MTDIFIMKGRSGDNAHTEGRWSCEDRGRNRGGTQLGAKEYQGWLATSRRYEEARKDFCLEPSKGV